MHKLVLHITFSLLIINGLYSQGTLKINGTNFVASGNAQIVLNNINFQNDGTFMQGTSTVHITGNAAQTQANVGGTASTTFYNLTVNKSANNAQLTQDITVSNALTLTMGCLDIKNNNILSTGTISNTATCFLKTSGTGMLKKNVGSSAVMFPVGFNSFTPLSLTNSGTVDNFTVRVSNQVLVNGNSGTPSTTNVVNTTWYVSEEVTGGSNVNMTATWNGTDETATFNRNNCFIQHYTSGSWQSTAGAAAMGSNPYSISRSGITSFSPFSVASSGVPLPIELLSFTGKNTEGGNLLTWVTANEINNKGFDIERSPQPPKGALTTWDVLGFVNAKGKAAIYDFTDVAPPLGAGGLNYYRLKQWDLDGKYAYSKVIALNNDVKTALNIYPNPADESLTVLTNGNNDLPYSITNMLGQVVKTGTVNTQTTLDISSFLSGTYFIHCNEIYIKFVKQH